MRSTEGNSREFSVHFVLASSQIQRILSEWIFRESKLRSASQAQALRNDFEKRSRDVLSEITPSANYNLMFTVFNPRPDIQSVNWEVRDAIEGESN